MYKSIAYGAGARPKIEVGGEVEDAVRLYNVQNIELRNFEVTNHGEQAAVYEEAFTFFSATSALPGT